METQERLECPKTLPPIKGDPPCAVDLPIEETIPIRPELIQAKGIERHGDFLKIPIGPPPPRWLAPTSQGANDDIRLPHSCGITGHLRGKQRIGAEKT